MDENTASNRPKLLLSKQSLMDYLVVTDAQLNQLCVISKLWLNDELTDFYYPPYTSNIRINEAAMQNEPPNENWTSHQLFEILAMSSKLNIFH